MLFQLHDRLGGVTELAALPGESVATVLHRHRIPIPSVVVLKDEQVVVNETQTLTSGGAYVAQLIEGYDLSGILNTYEDLYGSSVDAPAVLARLRLDVTGQLETSRYELSLDAVVQYVEDTVGDTCAEFDVFSRDAAATPLLLGLSGGVDSTALLLALVANKYRFPGLQLVTATFEDVDTASATHQRAADMARAHSSRHLVVPAELARSTFHLKMPLLEALRYLMNTEDAHKVMYADHHTTRRALELAALEQGISRIALGLHVSDLVAGLLNGMFTGYAVDSIPVRKVGEIEYVYPLAFLHKRLLHLYYRAKTGAFATHAHPNAWELQPTDRNFYYYLADSLLELWPGAELFLYSAHKWRGRRSDAKIEEQCENCGSTLLHQRFTSIDSDWCDVCAMFIKHGLLEEG